MLIQSRTSDGITTITLDGAFGAGSGDALHDMLLQAVEGRTRAIVLDLLAVTRIDAAGLGELARAFTVVQAYGSEFKIVVQSDVIREMLIRTRLTTVLPTFSSSAEALASLAAA